MATGRPDGREQHGSRAWKTESNIGTEEQPDLDAAIATNVWKAPRSKWQIAAVGRATRFWSEVLSEPQQYITLVVQWDVAKSIALNRRELGFWGALFERFNEASGLSDYQVEFGSAVILTPVQQHKYDYLQPRWLTC